MGNSESIEEGLDEAAATEVPLEEEDSGPINFSVCPLEEEVDADAGCAAQDPNSEYYYYYDDACDQG